MRVQTFYFAIEFPNGRVVEFKNLSRVAFKRYYEWYDKYLDQEGVSYNWYPNELKRSNNWLAEAEQ